MILHHPAKQPDLLARMADLKVVDRLQAVALHTMAIVIQKAVLDQARRAQALVKDLGRLLQHLLHREILPLLDR